MLMSRDDQRRHTPQFRPTLTPAKLGRLGDYIHIDKALAERQRSALETILPFRRLEYPGRTPLLRAISGARKLNAVYAWFKGTSLIGHEALERIVAYARSQAVALNNAADELERMDKERAARRKPSGWQVVRDRNGVVKDGRGRGGRPKTSV